MAINGAIVRLAGFSGAGEIARGQTLPLRSRQFPATCKRPVALRSDEPEPTPADAAPGFHPPPSDAMEVVRVEACIGTAFRNGMLRIDLQFQ